MNWVCLLLRYGPAPSTFPLDKNRLKRLPVPEYVKRERVLEGWELLKLREAASPNVWRLIMAALQIGLRENKLIETHEEWLRQRGDGW